MTTPPESEDPALAALIANAQAEDAEAQYQLGLRYLHGIGVVQDDQQGGEWLAQAVAQGHLPAMGEFGMLFRMGRGTDPDLLQAAQIHLAAAQQGDETSQYQLADYKAELVGMALAGNREAAFDLSRMYDWALGVKRDPASCWAWVRWARDECPPMPEEELRTPDLDDDVERAHTFFEGALDAGVLEAGNALFDMLQQQRGKAGG